MLRPLRTLLTLPLFFFPAIAFGDAPASKPNVVIFFADDMGFGDCKVYNQASLIDMPNLERLAAEGMSFRDAHSPASLCQPSRYAILAGNYPFRGGGAWNFNGGANLYEGQVSIGAMMQMAGYRTSMFGKGHIGARVPTKGGGLLSTQSYFKHMYQDMDLSRPLEDALVSRGFDYSFVMHGGIQGVPYAYFENDLLVTHLDPSLTFAPFDNPPDYLETSSETFFPGTPDETSVDFVVWDNTSYPNENGVSSFKGQNFHTSIASRNAGDPEFNGAGFGMPYWQTNHAGFHITSKAVDFIDQHHQSNLDNSTDTPFFMHFCAEAVHEPQQPPIDFDYAPNTFDPNNPVTPVKGVTRRSDGVAPGTDHMDMLLQLDVQLGKLLDALETRGILDNTIVIVTSDNGGRTDSRAAGQDSNAGLTGKKSRIWEGGSRVPMIVRWGDGTPGGSMIPPGTWNEEMVNIIDIYATLAEINGLSLDDGQAMDSFSMLPLWLDPAAPAIRETMLMKDSSAHAIRKDGWKLIIDNGTPIGLYDLATDLREIPDWTDPAQMPDGNTTRPTGVSNGDTPNNFLNDPTQATRISDMLADYNEQYDSTTRTSPPINFGDTSTPTAPLANDDSATATSGNKVSISVLENDLDLNGDALTAKLVTPPSHGGLLQIDGSFFYSAPHGFTGEDSFTYLANDGDFDSNIATVIITVSGAGASLDLLYDFDTEDARDEPDLTGTEISASNLRGFVDSDGGYNPLPWADGVNSNEGLSQIRSGADLASSLPSSSVMTTIDAQRLDGSANTAPSALSEASYLEFTIRPAPGQILDLSSASFSAALGGFAATNGTTDTNYFQLMLQTSSAPTWTAVGSVVSQQTSGTFTGDPMFHTQPNSLDLYQSYSGDGEEAGSGNGAVTNHLFDTTSFSSLTLAPDETVTFGLFMDSTASNGARSGTLIDDIALTGIRSSGQAAAPSGEFHISQFTLDEPSDEIHLTLDGLQVGSSYRIARSADLKIFTTISGSEFTANSPQESIVVTADSASTPSAFFIAVSNTP